MTEGITASISQERFQEVFEQVVRDILKEDDFIKDHILEIVDNLVTDLLPQSSYYEMIKEEIHSQLSRYPAVVTDETLRTKIAITILNHIQGPGRF